MIDISRAVFPALKKALRLRGSIPLTLDGTIVPTIQVADIDRLPYLEEDTFSWALNCAAVVGEYAAWAMAAPTGYMLVLDWWRPIFTTGQSFFWLNYATSFAATANFADRVARQAMRKLPMGNPNTTSIAPGVYRGGTIPSAPVGQLHLAGMGCPAGTFPGPLMQGPWVTDEENALHVQSDAVNNQAACAFYGRLLPRA